jgi:hypothetical protein
VTGALVLAGCGSGETTATDGERALERYGLATDTSKRLVEIDEFVSGGPAKDGIPALTDPLFDTLEKSEIPDDVDGVLVEIGADVRFYPYNVLVWHEIVNNVVGGTPVAVTFCPLCGSALVFDRRVDGETLEFGVSGLLHESNLVMYDRRTESVWSQARGMAIAGEYTGTELDLVSAQFLTVGQVKETTPEALILSEDTGYARDYRDNPYSGYEQSERLIAPVARSDARFPAKTLMFVFRIPEGPAVAVPRDGLPKGLSSSRIAGRDVSLEHDGVRTSVTVDATETPVYLEMWFSFVTQHGENAEVWEPADDAGD